MGQCDGWEDQSTETVPRKDDRGGWNDTMQQRAAQRLAAQEARELGGVACAPGPVARQHQRKPNVGEELGSCRHGAGGGGRAEQGGSHGRRPWQQRHTGAACPSRPSSAAGRRTRHSGIHWDGVVQHAASHPVHVAGDCTLLVPRTHAVGGAIGARLPVSAEIDLAVGGGDASDARHHQRASEPSGCRPGRRAGRCLRCNAA